MIAFCPQDRHETQFTAPPSGKLAQNAYFFIMMQSQKKPVHDCFRGLKVSVEGLLWCITRNLFQKPFL